MARCLSTLCHPLLMPLYMALLVVAGPASGLSYPAVVQVYVLSNVAFMTLLIPLALLLLMRLFGHIRKGVKWGMKSRVMMLALVAVSTLGCGWVFADVVVLFLLRKMLYTAAVVTFVILLFEFFYPLDYHTTAFGALLAMIWVLLYVGTTSLMVYFLVGIFVCGLLISARLYLSDSPVGSKWLGLAVGILISSVFFILS